MLETVSNFNYCLPLALLLRVNVTYLIAVTVTVLLLEFIALNLVLAKGALIDLNMKIQFLRLDNRLNPGIHSHLLQRLYNVSPSLLQTAMWYCTLTI